MFGDKELGVLDFRSLGNALYPEPVLLQVLAREILDHWEMRSIRNKAGIAIENRFILDHWEMRSIRNSAAEKSHAGPILDHWEMRSIRNPNRAGPGRHRNFRSLGNALYPELGDRFAQYLRHFRSLGNALYPERNK